MNALTSISLLIASLLSLAAPSTSSPAVPTKDFRVEIISPSLGPTILPGPNVTARLVASGLLFSEGPVYIPAPHNTWFFSDLVASSTHLVSGADYALTPYSSATKAQNGNAWDASTGSLIICESATRTLTRIDFPTKEPSFNGAERTVLADNYNGVPFTAPNDLVIRSDGVIFFTDPHYGAGPGRFNGGTIYDKTTRVYAYDPATGSLHRIISDLIQPNGIALSPDETRLYVADSGAINITLDLDVAARPTGHTIYEYKISGPGQKVESRKLFASNKVKFADISPGIPDGIKTDRRGNLYSSTHDGVHVYSKNAELLVKIIVGKTVGNIAFGGEGMNQLMICASDEVFIIDIENIGIAA